MNTEEIEMGEVITIRRSTTNDRDALGQLAELDSSSRPEGDALLAFDGGELVAALPLNGGEAIADPFHRTADVVELLRVRAGQGGHSLRDHLRGFRLPEWRAA
jgi:hypothetical protein